MEESVPGRVICIQESSDLGRCLVLLKDCKTSGPGTEEVQKW